MKKPVFAMLLGGFLGIFDGLSALLSAPQEAPNIVTIVIGSTFKGEKAKVLRVDKQKEEVIVELLEAAVPIPITLKMDGSGCWSTWNKHPKKFETITMAAKLTLHALITAAIHTEVSGDICRP